MTESNKKDRATTPPTEEEDAPLLSISSLTKPTARIDIDFGAGLRPFHFVNLDAIGIRQRQIIADLLTETFDLGGRSVDKPFTKKQEVVYDTKLRELALHILPKLTKKQLGTLKSAKEDPPSGLGTGHLSDIAVAFFVSSGESVPAKLELTKRMQALASSLPNPTGAKSSQGFKGSTNREGRRRARKRG